MRRLFWIAFCVVYALLCVLFVAGYVGYYLPSSMLWWTELVAVGLPYLSMLLVAATFVLISARRWKLLAVHAVLLLLVAIRFGPLMRAAPPARAASQGEYLEVITFNVPRWWGYVMDRKAAEMLALVRREQPHLLTFQEAILEYHAEAPTLRAAPYLAVLIDSLGYGAVGPSISEGYTYTIQPVLGHGSAELLSQEEILLRRHPTDERTTRIVRVHFRWQGREAVLYNIHLRTFGEQKPWQDEDLHPLSPSFWVPYLRQYHEAYLIRAWEVEEIRQRLARETLPLLVCGDLNSTPHNGAYRRLSEGFRDAFVEAGQGWGMTFHTRFPFARIDYVLYSDAWEAVSARVLDDVWLSDHRPLAVRLRWKDIAR